MITSNNSYFSKYLSSANVEHERARFHRD